MWNMHFVVRRGGRRAAGRLRPRDEVVAIDARAQYEWMNEYLTPPATFGFANTTLNGPHAHVAIDTIQIIKLSNRLD